MHSKLLVIHNLLGAKGCILLAVTINPYAFRQKKKGRRKEKSTAELIRKFVIMENTKGLAIYEVTLNFLTETSRNGLTPPLVAQQGLTFARQNKNNVKNN